MTAKDKVLRGSSPVLWDAGASKPACEILPGSSGRDKKIALFGLFGSGNLGNDGSLKAMIEFLREACPDRELFCICRNREAVSRAFGLAAVELRYQPAIGVPRLLDRMLLKFPVKLVDFVRAIRIVSAADMMIVPGTGILDDFGEKPRGMPFDIFKWCLAAKLAGTRVAFVSIGAGPIRNRLSRWLMMAAAYMADYRSYRDLASMEFMLSQGTETSRDGLYPDLAFRLKAPRTFPLSEGDGLIVGIGLMNYRGWYGYQARGDTVFAEYIGKMARFVRALLEGGYEIRLLVGDSEDWVAVEALRGTLSISGADACLDRVAAQVPASLDDVMRQIAGVDVLIATRFHNIVCAFKMARPTISIGYAGKNEALMAEMSLGDYCQRIDELDINRLLDQFSRLVADRQNIAAILRRGVAECEGRLKEQETQLLSLLAPVRRPHSLEQKT